MEVATHEFLITAGILTAITVVFCAALAIAVAIVGAAFYMIGSTVALVPKFYRSFREGSTRGTWPAMVFYLVAPALAVWQGFFWSLRLDSASYIPVAEGVVQAHAGEEWMSVLLIFTSLVILMMVLSFIGLCVASFSWPHQAYREQGFNAKTIMLVFVLLVTAFLLPPVAVLVDAYPL